MKFCLWGNGSSARGVQVVHPATSSHPFVRRNADARTDPMAPIPINPNFIVASPPPAQISFRF